MLLYQLDKVAIQHFEYTKFSFKLIDLFEDFIPTKESIIIKVMCHDFEF